MGNNACRACSTHGTIGIPYLILLKKSEGTVYLGDDEMMTGFRDLPRKNNIKMNP
jgi:hypothetical protein